MGNPVVQPLDLHALSREQLIELVESSQDGRIRIDFSGKANARRVARGVRPRTLSTLKKYSVGGPEEQARNLLIEGDNLQAMSTLYRERGQVDLVLTDPPYNTGNDFRYNDRWEEDPNDPGLGEFVAADDGARHTKWMRFMWPRLQMLKAMLKPTGVLAICIDYRELFRLGQLLDELFGEENRLGVINWQKTYSPRGDNLHLSSATEYVLVYAKDEARAQTGLLPRTERMDAKYRSPDGDLRLWRGDNASGPGAKTHQRMVYAIQSPFTGELHYPPLGSCWRSEQRQVLEWLGGWAPYVARDIGDAAKRAEVIGLQPEEIPRVRGLVLKGAVEDARASAEQVLASGVWPRLFFGLEGGGRPQLKRYLEEVKQGRVPVTFWADESFDEENPEVLGSVSWTHDVSGHSQTGVSELDAVVGKGHGFETVKPLRLFERIMQIWCPPDGLVLDPFAGSGTTAHAVLELNEQVEARRRFILIEQGRPERGDSYARSLTADRLRRITTGDWASGERAPLADGCRFARLDKKVDARALLSMEREELADTIIGSHIDAERRGPGLVRIAPEEGYEYLMARSAEGEGFFLVWNGADGSANFGEEAYERCAAEAKRAGLEARYHVYARLYLFQTANVVFYPIPDRILTDFGLDLRGEPYYEDGG